jgi:hypothetical protein
MFCGKTLIMYGTERELKQRVMCLCGLCVLREKMNVARQCLDRTKSAL